MYIYGFSFDDFVVSRCKGSTFCIFCSIFNTILRYVVKMNFDSKVLGLRGVSFHTTISLSREVWRNRRRQSLGNSTDGRSAVTRPVIKPNLS